MNRPDSPQPVFSLFVGDRFVVVLVLIVVIIFLTKGCV